MRSDYFIDVARSGQIAVDEHKRGTVGAGDGSPNHHPASVPDRAYAVGRKAFIPSSVNLLSAIISVHLEAAFIRENNVIPTIGCPPLM